MRSFHTCIGVRDVWLIDTKMDAQKAIVEALEHVVCVVQDDVSKGYTLRTAGLKSSLKGVLSETQACERAFGLGAQSVM